MSYCDFCANLPVEDLNKVYHDTAYGFPIIDDNELFGRLILEINQAGLSWSLMLKKEENFRKAFDQFQIDKIANYDAVKVSELLSNSGIIRNQLKINSVIYNAKQVVQLQNEFGSFHNWLMSAGFRTKVEWVKLFKKNFKFMGVEIVNEFLMSIGFLKGAHTEDCTIFAKTLKYNPKWHEKK